MIFLDPKRHLGFVSDPGFECAFGFVPYFNLRDVSDSERRLKYSVLDSWSRMLFRFTFASRTLTEFMNVYVGNELPTLGIDTLSFPGVEGAFNSLVRSNAHLAGKKDYNRFAKTWNLPSLDADVYQDEFTRKLIVVGEEDDFYNMPLTSNDKPGADGLYRFTLPDVVLRTVSWASSEHPYIQTKFASVNNEVILSTNLS